MDLGTRPDAPWLTLRWCWGGVGKKVRGATKAGRGPSEPSMAVSEQPSVAHPKLIPVPRPPKSVILALFWWFLVRCEQRCEYRQKLTI